MLQVILITFNWCGLSKASTLCMYVLVDRKIKKDVVTDIVVLI